MKKIIVFVLMYLPFLAIAQDSSELGILEVGGKITVNDFVYDSVAKVGTFADNRFMGQIFFGLSNSQIGIFGSYLSGGLLSEKYRAFSFEEFSGGLMFRQSIGLSEFKLGLGYYNREQRDFICEQPDRLERYHGIKALLGVVISQDESNLFPKLTLSVEHNFRIDGVSNWPQNEQVFSMRQYFSVSADWSLYALHFMPEFHFSPLLGVEIGQMTRMEPILKIGGTVSSNLIRADVVRFGYFFDTQRTGVEGFFLALNLAGFFSAM